MSSKKAVLLLFGSCEWHPTKIIHNVNQLICTPSDVPERLKDISQFMNRKCKSVFITFHRMRLNYMQILHFRFFYYSFLFSLHLKSQINRSKKKEEIYITPLRSSINLLIFHSFLIHCVQYYFIPSSWLYASLLYPLFFLFHFNRLRCICTLCF